MGAVLCRLQRFSLLGNTLRKLERCWHIVVCLVESQRRGVCLKVVELAVHDVFVASILGVGVSDVVTNCGLSGFATRNRIVPFENRRRRVRDTEGCLIGVSLHSACNVLADRR